MSTHNCTARCLEDGCGWRHEVAEVVPQPDVLEWADVAASGGPLPAMDGRVWFHRAKVPGGHLYMVVSATNTSFGSPAITFVPDVRE